MSGEEHKREAWVNEFSTSFDEQELVPGNTSIKRGIALAIVLKDQDIFFLSEQDGSVPLEAGHGFGLYYHDCRYLSGYEMRIGGRKPERLVCAADRGFQAVLGMSNVETKTTNGEVLPKHSVEIKWTRMVSSEYLALFDEIELRSLTFRPIEFIVSLTFQSAFEDMFAIRGLFQGRRGQLHQPEWVDGALCLAYDGADKLYRSLMINFSPAPAGTNQNTAFFKI